MMHLYQFKLNFVIAFIGTVINIFYNDWYVRAQPNNIEPIIPFSLPKIITAPGKYFLVTQGNSSFFRKMHRIADAYQIDSSNVLYEFLPSNGVFKKLTSTPFTLHHFGAVWFKNKIFFIGGFTTLGAKTNRVYTYQVDSKQWVNHMSNMHKKRAYFAAEINGNKLYCIWGDDVASIETFDFETNKWNTIEVRYVNGCKPLKEVVGSVSIDNNIYLFGNNGAFKIFNVSDGVIRDGEDTPFAFQYFGVTSFNRRIYISAGANTEGIDHCVYMYSTINKNWTVVGKIGVDRCGSGLLFHAGMLFFLGGSPNSMLDQNIPQGEIFIYRPMQ